LRAVEKGHDVWVDTGEATYVYRISETRIVEPSEVEVLDSGGRSELTLITCYPFDWVGPAPKRFVVTAHLRGRFEPHDRILDDVLGSGSGR
jgi:sortase A